MIRVLRPAEWASVERRDVDKVRRIVQVRGTKTHCSQREVPLTTAAMELREQRCVYRDAAVDDYARRVVRMHLSGVVKKQKSHADITMHASALYVNCPSFAA